MRTQQEAKAIGAHWLATLPKGYGWRVETWENLGWHFRLTSGNVAIYYHRYAGEPPRWFTGLTVGDDGLGTPMWCQPDAAPSPRKALAILEKVIDRRLDYLDKETARLQEIGAVVKASAAGKPRPRKKVTP